MIRFIKSLNKKKCIGDIISGVLLFVSIWIPYRLEHLFIFHSGSHTPYYVAQFVLTCIFAFVFVLFLVSRILKIADGKYEDSSSDNGEDH